MQSQNGWVRSCSGFRVMHVGSCFTGIPRALFRVSRDMSQKYTIGTPPVYPHFLAFFGPAKGGEIAGVFGTESAPLASCPRSRCKVLFGTCKAIAI